MDFPLFKTDYLVHKNRMVSLLPVVLWVLGRVAAVVAGAALVRAEVGAEGQLPRLPAAVRPPVRQRHVQPHPEGGVAVHDELVLGQDALPVAGVVGGARPDAGKVLTITIETSLFN